MLSMQNFAEWKLACSLSIQLSRCSLIRSRIISATTFVTTGSTLILFHFQSVLYVTLTIHFIHNIRKFTKFDAVNNYGLVFLPFFQLFITEDEEWADNSITGPQKGLRLHAISSVMRYTILKSLLHVAASTPWRA